MRRKRLSVGRSECRRLLEELDLCPWTWGTQWIALWQTNPLTMFKGRESQKEWKAILRESSCSHLEHVHEARSQEQSV